MAIQKHMLPILEYDEDPGAILMPNREEGYRFPEKAVFAFLGEEIEQYAVRNQCEMIGTFVTERPSVFVRRRLEALRRFSFWIF